MPKIKRKPDRFDKMRVLLMGQRELLGMGYEELGKKTGSSTGTAYNRLHHPEKMTVDELCRFARTLEIPADDFRAAIPMY